MLRNLPSETRNFVSLPDSPSDFAPNRRPLSAENHLILFDATPEVPQQLETPAGFRIDFLAVRFIDGDHKNDPVNEEQGTFKSTELLNQAFVIVC
jgi:hypothetical protein